MRTQRSTIRDAVARLAGGPRPLRRGAQRRRGTRTLRHVDRPEVWISTPSPTYRALSPILDDDSTLPGSFLLEVSSRASTCAANAAHYGAHGCTVSISSHRDRYRRYRVLVDDNDHCTIETDSRRRRFASATSRRRTVFEWGPNRVPAKVPVSRDREQRARRAEERRVKNPEMLEALSALAIEGDLGRDHIGGASRARDRVQAHARSGRGGAGRDRRRDR